jgi:hypothetical protein
MHDSFTPLVPTLDSIHNVVSKLEKFPRFFFLPSSRLERSSEADLSRLLDFSKTVRGISCLVSQISTLYDGNEIKRDLIVNHALLYSVFIKDRLGWAEPSFVP